MRDMRCLREAEAALTCLQNFTVSHSLRWTKSEIVDTYECANRAAHRLCGGSDLQPLVKRATLVRLKMAEANPAYLRGIHDRFHRFTHCGEEHSHAGMKQ